MSESSGGWLAPLSIPVSWLYGAAVRVRNRRFDGGHGVRALPVPVISVGNLVVGGAGKTPTVAHIVRLLADEGRRPLIAMRGYGARAGQMSDEQAEYARNLPDVPVVAHPDRHAAVSRFLQGEGRDRDCVVLDDAFQHRRLASDLDLVLVDASRRTFGERLLPAGELREPVSSLSRAGAVLVTRAHSIEAELGRTIERFHGRPPIAWARHAWTGLEVHDRRTRREPVAWLAGKRLITMLGVAHPRPIREQLEAAAAEVVSDVRARDHEHYGAAKLRRALDRARGLDGMVVTGKDWVKLERLAPAGGWPVPIVVPQLALDVFEGASSLERLILSAVV